MDKEQAQLRTELDALAAQIKAADALAAQFDKTAAALGARVEILEQRNAAAEAAVAAANAAEVAAVEAAAKVAAEEAAKVAEAAAAKAARRLFGLKSKPT